MDKVIHKMKFAVVLFSSCRNRAIYFLFYSERIEVVKLNAVKLNTDSRFKSNFYL